MGCTSSRIERINSELSSDCNNLMITNINLFRILECLHIQNHKISSALYTIYIKQQAEQYYNIIKSYRNFWISEARSSTSESQIEEKLERCEKEQIKELSELTFCKNILLKVISDIYPEWQRSYKSTSEFLEDLELSNSITQVSTTLYARFYLASKKEIKEGLAEYSQIPDSDKQVFKLLKLVAVDPYKSQKNCVYFTEKIQIRSKNKKFTQSVPISPKNEEVSLLSKETFGMKEPKIEIPITPQYGTSKIPKSSPRLRSNSSNRELIDLAVYENISQGLGENEISLSNISYNPHEDVQITELNKKILNFSSIDSHKEITKNETLSACEITVEEESSSYYSEEDEEYLARLSYSQK